MTTVQYDAARDREAQAMQNQGHASTVDQQEKTDIQAGLTPTAIRRKDSKAVKHMTLFDTVDRSRWFTHDTNNIPWRSPVDLSEELSEVVRAPLPENEEERIATVRQLCLNNNRPPNNVLCELMKLAAELCGCECSGITIIDHDTLFAKLQDRAPITFPRRETMCAWAILGPGATPFVVNDVRFDRRFAGSSLVKGYAVRTYIGAPLVAKNNCKVGVLCAFSSELVEMNSTRINGMQHLAERVMREIEADNTLVERTSLRDEKQMQQLSHELRTPLHSIVGHAQLLLDSGLSSEQLALTGNILKSAEFLTRVITNMLEARLTVAELASNAQQASQPWEDLRKIELAMRSDLIHETNGLPEDINNIKSPQSPFEESVAFGLSPADIRKVQQVWSTVMSADTLAIATSLTETLFELDPLLRVLFPFDLNVQRAKFMQMINVSVGSLSYDIKSLVEKLERVGRMHARMGVTPRMYPTLSSALLTTLALHLGTDWTKESRVAWKNVLGFISQTMINSDHESFPGLAGGPGEEAVASVGAYIESAGFRSPSDLKAGESIDRRSDYSWLRILNVDDNRMNRTLLTSMVARVGVVDVLEASNGQECLEVLQNDDQFDCVFLDLQMPIMGGTVACLRIRQRMRQRRPFLIAITADTTPGVGQRCRDAGFDAILRKPCSRRTIQETLDQAAAWRQELLS